MGQQIISDEDHDCFGKLTNQFTSEGSPIFVPNTSVVYFQEQVAQLVVGTTSNGYLSSGSQVRAHGGERNPCELGG